MRLFAVLISGAVCASDPWGWFVPPPVDTMPLAPERPVPAKVYRPPLPTLAAIAKKPDAPQLQAMRVAPAVDRPLTPQAQAKPSRPAPAIANTYPPQPEAVPQRARAAIAKAYPPQPQAAPSRPPPAVAQPQAVHQRPLPVVIAKPFPVQPQALPPRGPPTPIARPRPLVAQGGVPATVSPPAIIAPTRIPDELTASRAQKRYEGTVPVSPELAALTPTPAAGKVYQIRDAMQLELLPFVSIGVKAVRPGPRHDPPAGHRVACPSDRAYCIDYRSSDNGTCMYPDPLDIKRCYDGSCVQSAWGPIVRKQQGEDTYCKDFMTPSGRVCQWLDTVPCTCQSKSIYYYSGEFIPSDEPIPQGFKEAFPCTYPLDIIKKAAEEAARKAGQKNRRHRNVGNQDSGDPDSGNSEQQQPRTRPRRYQAEDDDSSSTSLLNLYLIASIIASIITLA